MTIIALFFPAAVSVLIRYKRTKQQILFSAKLVLDYFLWLITNVLLTEGTIVYVFGISEAQSVYFESFPFFVKYVVIAMIFACVIPYIVEIIKKYFRIEMEITKNEKE